ncbi:hypothetical protein BBP40_005222 [Aspergillus hancockii]|nr:hypothetical protein BBP40_005222 [Aspergillus hancockii]
MSTNVNSISESGEMNQQDVRFIIECLRSLDTDKNVNLNKVGAALGYTNTASVGNRFRAVRRRYGFDNFESTTKLPNADSASTSTASPEKSKGNGSDTGSKKSASKSVEHEEPVSDNPEPETIVAFNVPKAKAKRSPKKVNARKGARNSNNPIPVTSRGASKGDKHSQTQATADLNVKEEEPSVKIKDSSIEDEDMGVKVEGIDVHLLKAANVAFEELEHGDSFGGL